MQATARRITLEDVLRKLELRIIFAGSLRKAAREFGFTPQFLSQVLQRKELPSPRLLKHLGLRSARTVEYWEDPQPAVVLRRG